MQQRHPFSGLFLLLIIVMAVALSWGESVLDWLHWSAMQQFIFWEIRLPRVVLAALTGALLSISGVLLQVLFRNPLAEPSLIGVSASAALGAVLVIVFAGVWLAQVPMALLGLSAFMMAMMVTWIIYRLATRQGHTDVALMLLIGVAVNAFAAALIGMLVTLSSDEQLRTITFWSLGSFSSALWSQNLLLLAVALMVIWGLKSQSSLMNAYLLGEATCRQLGHDPKDFKKRSVFLVAIMVGSSVALVGGIGFVGLMVPHLMRLWVGNDHRLLLPASALAGAILLVLADTLARTLWAPMELPVGLLMALMGGPFFLWMLLQKQGLR